MRLQPIKCGICEFECIGSAEMGSHYAKFHPQLLWQQTALPKDSVNHPEHYTSHPSGVECITITRHYNFNVGNAIKYLWRAGLKDADKHLEDLEKAAWYVNDELKRLKGEVK